MRAAIVSFAVAAIACVQISSAASFLGASFDGQQWERRPNRPTRQNWPPQFAQLPPGLGEGNQDGDDDVFVFDRPSSPRPSSPRPSSPRPSSPRPSSPRPSSPRPSSPRPSSPRPSSPRPSSPRPSSPRPSGTTTANSCTTTCPTTGEFNPVCGTDRVTYTNPGKLNCAVSCGRSVVLSHYGSCITTTTTPSTTTTRQSDQQRGAAATA